MCCRTFSRRFLLSIAAIGVLIGLTRFAFPLANAAEDEKVKAEEPAIPAALNFEMASLEGEDVHLGKYYGDVVLMVNVASRCGLTKQYKALQALHEEYADKGLSILGFPANNFGKQEPGNDEEIAQFCERNYGVEFDMFSKISVKGDDQAPLYKHLTAQETEPKGAGEVSWNFEKFLVNREGKVIARFSPRTKPDDKVLLKAIKAELDKPVPAAAKAARKAADKAKGSE